MSWLLLAFAQACGSSPPGDCEAGTTGLAVELACDAQDVLSGRSIRDRAPAGTGPRGEGSRPGHRGSSPSTLTLTDDPGPVLWAMPRFVDSAASTADRANTLLSRPGLPTDSTGTGGEDWIVGDGTDDGFVVGDEWMPPGCEAQDVIQGGSEDDSVSRAGRTN